MLYLEYTFRNQQEYKKIRLLLKIFFKKVLKEENIFMIEVAVNEGVNNAIRHNRKNQPITLTVRVTKKNRLMIRIKDQGDGFDVDQYLKTKRETFEERLWEDSGRGISIMKHAFDELIYNKTGNELLLVKKLKKVG